MPPVGRRWSAGVRAATAFGVPALLVALAGFPGEALLVVSGSVAVVYGERRPYRIRWRIVTTAGVCLVASAWIGAVSATAGSAVVPIVTLTCVAAVAVYVVSALRLGPPGAFFFVLVCAMSSYLPDSGTGPGETAAFAAFGAASAVVTAMSGALRAPSAPERRAVDAAQTAVEHYANSRHPAERHRAGSALHHAWTAVYDSWPAGRGPLVDEVVGIHRQFADLTHPDGSTPGVGDADRDVDSPSVVLPLAQPSVLYRLRRSAAPSSHAVTTSIRVVTAALMAGGASLAAGLGRPDWAVLGAVLVLQQGPDRVHGTYRGIHRIAGTLLGVGLFAALALSPMSDIGAVVAVVVLLFAIELTMPRNYGVAVLFITPMALIVGSLSHPDAVLSHVVLDRIVETTIGVACAFLALWLVLPHGFRRAFLWSDARVVHAASELAAGAGSRPAADCATLRRDLQFELVGSAIAAAEAAHNDRRWTSARWERHSDIDHLGYQLLAACWNSTGVLPDSERWFDRTRSLPHGTAVDEMQ